MYTETRKNFVLKLLAFFKRDVEAKLICGKLCDEVSREKVLGWSSDPANRTPALVKITLGDAKVPLAQVTFERLSDDIEEFEVIEDLDRSKRQAYFEAEAINSILPDLPLVCRSLLTASDISMVVEEALSKASCSEMETQTYKHRKDKLIFITVHKTPNIAQLLKDYAKRKLRDDVTQTLDPRNTDVTATQEDLDLLLTLTDTATKLLPNTLKSSTQSSLDLLNHSSNSASRRDKAALLRTVASKKATIPAVHEIDNHMLQTDERAVADIRTAVKDLMASFDQDQFSTVHDATGSSQPKRLSNILIIH